MRGVAISKALGSRRAIILAHHGYLTAGKTVEEATYLSVYLERATRMQIRARAFGPLTPVDDILAREAHDYLLQPSIVNSTFDDLVPSDPRRTASTLGSLIVKNKIRPDTRCRLRVRNRQTEVKRPSAVQEVRNSRRTFVVGILLRKK